MQYFQKACFCEEELLPGVGNGLPADRRDKLDGKLVLLRINVPFICRMEKQKQQE